MEAMLTGNPIISTGCGGIHEYLTDKKDAYLLPYTLVNLKENTRNKNWYTMDQKWAEVQIDDIRKAMRHVFENKEEREAIGKTGQETVKREFSIEAVGIKMRDRLKESYKLVEPQII
jgi:glycosyltransferase involved in cell wall biosynthesis